MSRNTKIILAVVAGLLVLCCACSVLALVVGPVLFFRAGNSNFVSSEDAPAAAAQIADFTLPAGFYPSGGMHTFGMSLVAYEHSDGQSHLFLFQMPSWVQGNAEAMRRQMEQQMQRSATTYGNDRLSNLRAVETVQVTVRGEPATFTMMEGTNSDGTPFRMMSGMFQGRNGLVFLTIARPAGSWNQGEIDAFLASIQ
jgi:hypothetical protein